MQKWQRRPLLVIIIIIISSITVCLCIVVLFSLLDVLVEVGLLLAVWVVGVLLSPLFSVVQCAQALVNALVVVAHAALVVRLARLPLETLTSHKNRYMLTNKAQASSTKLARIITKEKENLPEPL